ncbi:ATP-binding protein [Streptosporangium saharense]|uniref:ATP-binding protein n=1 Tax=Streptosporangium saharense TaxID=1706840 RepID=UPI0036C9AF0B
MDTREISLKDALDIVDRQESHFWDVKSKLSGGAKIQKIASSLANAEGGEFAVGIEDAKTGAGVSRWQGFTTIEDGNWVQSALVQEIHPPIPYDIDFLVIKGQESRGVVCLVTVQKSPDVHRTADNKVWRRRGAQDLPLHGSAIADLTLSKGAKSYEDQVLEDYDLEELSEESELEYFLKEYTPASTPEKFLRRQRLLSRKPDTRGTVAAAILFAEEPAAVVPKRCSVKIARYETSQSIADRKYLKETPLTVDGPARLLIDETLNRVTQIIQGVPVLHPDGKMAPMKYPPEALKEIIVNAVIHRDYNISDDILVSIFDNRVEVRSPGRLPGHITKENILEERFARNPSIVRLLNKYPDPPNKDIGEGLDTVFRTMRAAKLKEPVLRVEDNSFTVVLEHTPLARPEELILEYLENNEEIRNSTGRKLTGIESENAMKRIFYKLRDRNKIELVPNRNKFNAAWRLKK